MQERKRLADAMDGELRQQPAGLDKQANDVDEEQRNLQVDLRVFAENERELGQKSADVQAREIGAYRRPANSKGMVKRHTRPTCSASNGQSELQGTRAATSGPRSGTGTRHGRLKRRQRPTSKEQARELEEWRAKVTPAMPRSKPVARRNSTPCRSSSPSESVLANQAAALAALKTRLQPARRTQEPGTAPGRTA